MSETAEKRTPPNIWIGAQIPKYGTIKMIGWIGGERYYWMIDRLGSVSMMPACVVEKETNS